MLLPLLLLPYKAGRGARARSTAQGDPRKKGDLEGLDHIARNTPGHILNSAGSHRFQTDSRDRKC